MKKSISIILLAILISQGCVTIYQKTPVTWAEVSNKGKLKIETVKGKEIKYINIEMNDSDYYGVKGKKKIKLDTSLISNIYLKDIKKSKLQTTLNLLSIPVFVGIYILVITNIAEH